MILTISKFEKHFYKLSFPFQHFSLVLITWCPYLFDDLFNVCLYLQPISFMKAEMVFIHSCTSKDKYGIWLM